jgi:hypothetical protein
MSMISAPRGGRALLAAAAACALAAGAAQAANLPTQTTTTEAGDASPSSFAGTKADYGKALNKGSAVFKGAAVVSLSASVPGGSNNITGTCPAGTAFASLGTPSSPQVQDAMGRGGQRAIAIEVTNDSGAAVDFTDFALCIDKPSASVKVAGGGGTSPITFPTSEEVRNPPKQGGKLKANQRLVTIRTKDLHAGVPSLIPVTCRGASFGYQLLLAAADGVTARPNAESVTVFAPKRTPSGTQAIYGICQN